MFKLVSVILRGMRESKREKKERDLTEKECISLLSFKRISWCASRGAGETEKTRENRERGRQKHSCSFTVCKRKASCLH